MIVFKINKYLNERLSALACFMDVNMTADNLCGKTTRRSLSRFDLMLKNYTKNNMRSQMYYKQKNTSVVYNMVYIKITIQMG